MRSLSMHTAVAICSSVGRGAQKIYQPVKYAKKLECRWVATVTDPTVLSLKLICMHIRSIIKWLRQIDIADVN